MNKYMHAAICGMISILKFGIIKIERRSEFKASFMNLVSPRTEITVEKGAKLRVV